jgi:hypothetical protein
MPPALLFHQMFRHALNRQVEYSFGEEGDTFTTMTPLGNDLLPRVIEVAGALGFPGEWAWAVKRFCEFAQPPTFLFRLDELHRDVSAITLYCRFPSEPDDSQFHAAIRAARPFRWNGPAPSRIAHALQLPGPRGIAFRTNRAGNLRTALYFRSEEHVGPSWNARLTALLTACQYPEQLATAIDSNLKAIYTPGPAGVIGIDSSSDDVPAAVKFDPSNVPLPLAFAFLRKIGVSAPRIAALAKIALGLRAESVSYVGVKYSQSGFAGWRLYFSCEPAHHVSPARANIVTQRNLRPTRRLPHY